MKNAVSFALGVFVGYECITWIERGIYLGAIVGLVVWHFHGVV